MMTARLGTASDLDEALAKLVEANMTIYSESPAPGRYRYRVQAFNLTTQRLSDYSNEASLRVK